MNKKALATAMVVLGLFPSLLFAQLYRMEVDAQESGSQKVIDRVFTGNTVGLQVSFYDGGDPLPVTNWTMRFMYGYGQYDTNGMVPVVGTAGASNNVVVFDSSTNVFFSENGSYYFSIVGTNTDGKIKTFARGRMIEEYDPATGGSYSNGIPMPWANLNFASKEWIVDYISTNEFETVVSYGTNSTTAYRGDWGASASNLAASAVQPADTNGWVVSSHSGLATEAQAGQIATNVASGYLPLSGYDGLVVLGTRTRGYAASTNLGAYGFAAGSGTSAGDHGFAAGDGTSAGSYGFAAGSGTSAGYAGFAAGESTSAGYAGFAAGVETSAGEAGFAAGVETSAGEAGFAAGVETSAGEAGFAAGDGTSAGNYGFAAGESTTAGDFGFAAGASTSAGEAGFAAGESTSAGNYGFAAGESTSAGEYGFAAGDSTSAGNYGFAAGAGTSAGDYGFAAGWSTSAGDYGFAAGTGTSAGNYGFAAGVGTSAGEYGFAAGEGTSAGEYGFAAGMAARGADGSFVFADNSAGGTPFNRTNRTNEFSARAAGGVYFDTPMMAVTGTVSAGSFVGDGSGLTGIVATSTNVGATKLVANVAGAASVTSSYDAASSTLTLSDLPVPESGAEAGPVLAEGTPQALALADGFVTIWSTGLWEQAYTAAGAATVRVVKANATNSAALIWHATLSNFPTFFITNNLLGFTATGISTNGGTTTVSLRSKPGSTNWTWSVDLP